MLVAKNERGQLVRASDAQRTRGHRCPECDAPLVLRQGSRVPHFAHRPKQGCQLAQGESELHLLGKETLWWWAKQRGWNPQLEVPFDQIEQRADVLVTIQNHLVALEFQCSPLSARRLAERTQGYQQVGVAVRWLLGPTYQKRLLHREIQARFTQLVNNRPSLTFWEPHRAQLDYLQPIYQGQVGNGRWWAQVGVETVDLHRHASLRDGLVRQAYQAGHQVAACPLVAHGRREWWPLTFERPVRWRLMILLALEQLPLGKSWPPLGWQAWLATQTKWLPLPALTPVQRQALRMHHLNELTADLLQAGIITIREEEYRYVRLPQWFDDFDQKLAFVRQQEGI